MRFSQARITGCSACSRRVVGQSCTLHLGSSPLLQSQRNASTTDAVSAAVAKPSIEARKHRAFEGAKQTGLRWARSVYVVILRKSLEAR